MLMTQETQLARLGLFDAKVPRYTSYPTAPHFKNDVDTVGFTHWVRSIKPDSEISLYLHVPFCRRLCWFCACRTQGTKSDARVAAYVEVLKQEIALLRDVLPQGIKLSRLHWGGGTPTLLTPELITDLAQTIFDVTPLAKGGEFSVEIDPNEVDSTRVAALAAAGMNRASIGVQDFDPEIQQTIGRIQPYELTRDVVTLLRGAGINSLNADILYGLPHQTPKRLTESVQKLLSLNPDRVALYGYAHVPWMARRQTMIPTEALPTPQARFELFETAKKLFHWDGYRDIGIDHFAVSHDSLAVAQANGVLRRNFQGYTNDTSDVLIGLGASSISRFPQGFSQNNPSTSGYITSIQNKQFSTTRGHSFQGEDLMRARMIEALMCDFKINNREITTRFEIDYKTLTDIYQNAAAQFPDMINIDQESFRILPQGRPLTRMIAQCFDAYDTAGAKHSSAV